MKPMADPAYLFQHVASVLQRQSDQALQERLGIGMSQYRILLMLQEHPEVEQRRIADSLGQTEASISRQVKLLLERGMLVSAVDPEERRRRIATLTSKGIKIAHAAQEVLQQYYAPLLDTLSPKQQTQLREILTTLHEQTCAPGKPMACDRPFDLDTVYALQADALGV